MSKKPRTTFRITIFIIFMLAIANIIGGACIAIYYFSDLSSIWELDVYIFAAIILLVTLITSIVFALILRHNIFSPLSKLVTATQQVASGDFDVQLDIPHNSMTNITEVGSLIDSFNDMAAELRRNALFKNDFVHNFSHEFKTPIISIRGFAKQIYQGNLTPEQEQEFAKIILDESEHLSNLSSNVLLLTKLENQEIISDKVAFSLDEQLRDCMLLFEEQWSDKNLNINMELDEITYHQNPELLSYIWRNLISNAIKFSTQGGSLTVKCYQTQGSVAVIVSDTGIGMRKETSEHIFEKFYQGDPSHATPGNGLGLSLVKRIIDMVGGRISVRSQENVGSTFSVTLPMQGR